MGIGTFFAGNAINVARAVERQAGRHLTLSSPVQIAVGSDDPAGASRMYIVVLRKEVTVARVDVDDADVDACRQVEGPAATEAFSELVDRLSARVLEAARAAGAQRG